MKRICLFGLPIFLLLLFSTLIFAQEKGVKSAAVSKLPAKEKRWALIIGVDVYQKEISPLNGTVNDAKALREALIQNAGFTDERIILMTTDSKDSDLIPTRSNIIYQLDKLQRVVPEDGLILFSFSGHGVSIGNDAFIVPSDGRIYQDAELMRDDSIDVLRIRRAIQNTKVKQVIMFLDACRNDPVRAKGGADNDLTAAYSKGFSFDTKNQNIEAYATLYATSFGDRAYEFLDKKNNKWRGYFSYAIEEGLKGAAANDKGEVTLAGLIKYTEETVKERVRINENQRQIPYPATEGFRNSDLVIAAAEKNTPIIVNPNSGEASFWNSIENSNYIDDFENYLQRIESGEFKGIYKSTAEIKFAKLKKANIAAAWTRFRPTANLLLKYENVFTFSERLAMVHSSGKWGLVYKTGKEAVSLLKYDYMLPLSSEGLAIIGLDGKYGFIDKNGEEIVAPKYDLIQLIIGFHEGLLNLELDGKYGFIDQAGNEVIPFKYYLATNFSEGLASVKLNDKWTFIDKSGSEVRIPLKYNYDIVFPFSDGLSQVELNDKNGFIDKSGKEITSLKYDEVAGFSDGTATVKLNNKWGFIDKSGKEFISLKYDDVVGFSSGLAKVKLNNKWGFIDKSGKEVIPLKYEDLGTFSEDLVSAKLNGKWGFIDKKGTVIVPLKYDSFEKEDYSFSDGLAKVRLNNKWGYLDKSGKELFPLKFDDVSFISNDLIEITINGKVGFIDRTGKEIIPVRYNNIWCYVFAEQGFIGITLNGKKGFVDTDGNEYFDF